MSKQHTSMAKGTIVRDLFGRVGVIRVKSNRAIIDASVDWFELSTIKPGLTELANIAIEELLQLRLYCPGKAIV